jgi:cytochrome c
MSGLELNKIAAAILLAALIAMVVGVVANVLYKPKLEVAQRGYQVEVSEAPSGDAASAPEVPVDIAQLMATANAEEGAKVVKKCLACHTLEEGGANKVGPHLWKIYGAEKAKREGFVYSKAMAAVGGIWDNENLYHFLNKPSKFMPGTKMSFAGLSKPQDIVNVIAYLKEKAS